MRSGPSLMDVNTFASLLCKVPNTIEMQMSGVADPFLHPKIHELLSLINGKGHPIFINTTLQYTSVDDLDKIRDLNLVGFNIHLPTHYNEGFLITDEYLHKLRLCEEYFPRSILYCTVLGVVPQAVAEVVERFRKYTLSPLNISNKIDPKITPLVDKKFGPLMCSIHNNDAPLVFPNGDVTLCSEDSCMKHILGNLFEQSYEEVEKGLIRKDLSRRCREHDSDLLCRECSFAVAQKLC